MCEPKTEGSIGFKELSLFNDALLAKQTWRLLHNKNSLFYRVFKSKFFPNCSIMEAKQGHGGSYAWRSILVGREVIWRGGTWRVGNGESIKLWGDRWLPFLSHTSLQGPLVAELQEATVSYLINLATSSWDSSILCRLFSQHEATEVQKIQLSQQPSEDALFWPFVQSGVYSAKSGYYFLKTKARMSALPRS